jgi:hypothetical protein
MSEANPEYVIATVSDFLKVPENRQADCLAEFADFLGVARGIVELFGTEAAAQIGPFAWIDDGKRNRTIRIHAQNTARQDRSEAKGEL